MFIEYKLKKEKFFKFFKNDNQIYLEFFSLFYEKVETKNQTNQKKKR